MNKPIVIWCGKNAIYQTFEMKVFNAKEKQRLFHLISNNSSIEYIFSTSTLRSMSWAHIKSSDKRQVKCACDSSWHFCRTSRWNDRLINLKFANQLYWNCFIWSDLLDRIQAIFPKIKSSCCCYYEGRGLCRNEIVIFFLINRNLFH